MAIMDILSILSLIVGIVGFGYAFYSTNVFSKGVKIAALQQIRSLINRMEEEKHKHQENSTQWSTMHHTQQELDVLFKGIQAMFKVSNKDAPLS